MLVRSSLLTLLGGAMAIGAIAVGAASLPACGSDDPDKPAGEGDAGVGATTFPRTVPIKLEAPLDPQKKYRLGAFWVQLDDDGPDPLNEVGLDVPFDPAATTVTFNAPALPTEKNFICERDCDDEATCACRATSPYRIGYGAIFIAEDVDQNGKIELSSGSDDAGSKDLPVRFGFGAFVYSPNGHDQMPPSKDGGPSLIDGEVQQGTVLYGSYKKTGTFDRLTRFLNGQTLEFRLKAPNVT